MRKKLLFFFFRRLPTGMDFGPTDATQGQTRPQENLPFAANLIAKVFWIV